ncbi:Phosphate uptake regulator [Streptococcus suis 05ZYH33]|nr:Phosphate uptake regulator [Streptococcus suis 05ZYH33]
MIWSVWETMQSQLLNAAIRMKGEVRIPVVEEEIKKMGREVRQLVEETLELYLGDADMERAYEVAARDEVVNEFYSTIQELTTEEIKKNPESLVAGRDYYQVLTYLERVGDYAKNICEWVVYLRTGDITEL